ncbi:hypothetical protein H4R33_003077 [Dimargaris cristalligena]|uniref:S-adenosyl-L-methionine-dependent methyltransferase n=1 Tax=Dimargaris cristalligena TaxID=215637 RepID=A0A4V1J4T0_9FUNG|nr:hypothetical protein H4R33_003077 [Dimargaris cristalligena]RKP36629.1 S-adenosyl-L-methionine-dependent methyltransferase [Dimargaris cristalligena]|eukprot:RKP36629.1 S-adenosyl-L-methionine-dependent methyltransferase [Dimargaris cristalligena]
MAHSDDTKDHWKPQLYQQEASFVPALTESIVSRLQPHLNSEVTLLDLGCGDGVLTRTLQSQCARVVGVDMSSAMIEAARINGCQDARVADGSNLRAAQVGDGEFDVVFSNAALHWMKRDPGQVVREVNRSLRPSGMFIGEMGGHLNVAAIHATLIDVVNRHGQDGEALSPWFFPTEQEYRTLLEQNGFQVQYIELVPRITALPGDVRGWLNTFAAPFVEGFDTLEEREKILDEVQEILRPVTQRPGGHSVMYTRLRFVAQKTSTA